MNADIESRPVIRPELVMNDIGVIWLNNGGFVIVDSEMVPYLSQRKWFRSWDGYAFGSTDNGKVKSLSHFIIVVPDGMLADHKNGQKVDYRRQNLRPVTFSQSNQNVGKRAGCTSPLKGVYWRLDKSKWAAQIRVSGRKLHLGYFDSEIPAAKAYNRAAVKYFGEFARINTADHLIQKER